MEGVKIRYPEYCRELPPAKKQAETGAIIRLNGGIKPWQNRLLPCGNTRRLSKLLSVLEQNSLSKQKEEVTGPMVGYIDGMEEKAGPR